MSRAFTKDEAPEDPIVVPPRAPLPAGVPNYVTPRGDCLLREERAELDAERSRLGAASDMEETERKRQLAAAVERIANLRERLARTQVVDPSRQSGEVVRFGAYVVLSASDGSERRFQIVGVDEAEPEAGRVAFTSPIARAVSGTGVGDVAVLRTASGEEQLVVHAIRYGEEA
ncbi:MAG: GreA/GreB family elongation factor [Bacteroidota bacterium]